MFIIEKDKPFYSSLSSLVLTYHFPIKEDNSYLTIFCIKFTIVKIMCIIFLCGGVFLHLVMTLKDKTGLDISEDVSVFLGNFGSLMTCSFFTIRWRQWSNFLNEVTDTSKFGKPADFDAVTKRGNLFSTMNFWYANIGIIVYGVTTLAEASYCKRINEDKGLHEVCGSIAPMWLPFEGDKLIVQIIIFTCQFLLLYYFISPSAIICFLTWEAAELLISHINHFKSNFLQIFEETTIQGRSNRLRFCIQYHNHILRMSNQLNVLVKFTVGHISLISAIVFGCIGNQIFKVKPIGAALYLAGYMIALFWLCHSGQRIMDETLSICETVYEAKWYKADANTMKDIRYILARSQIPICLDALPLGTLNYPLFLTIIKTSYSYLTLINQTL